METLVSIAGKMVSDMRRKWIAMACIVTAIALSIIIFWFTFLSMLSIDTTISEIMSNPEGWVNKKVRVNGILIGPVMYFPERILPYDFALYDKDNRTTGIGVLGSGGVQEVNPYVKLSGVVEEGQTVGLQGGDLVYYIKTEETTVLAVPIAGERIDHYEAWIWNPTNSSYSLSKNTYELRLKASRNDTWESVIIQQGVLPHNWTYLNNPLRNDYDISHSLSEDKLFFNVSARLGNWGFYGEHAAVKTYTNKYVPVIKIGLACYLEVNEGYQETTSRQLCVDKLLFIAYRENETTNIRESDTLYWEESPTDNDYHAQYLENLLKNETWMDLNIDFGEILKEAYDHYGFEKGRIGCVQVYAEGVNSYCDLSVSYAHMYVLK